MSMRINAGYIITDSIHVGEMEFVLGVHGTAPSQFVTWACKNGTDYFWGHYHSNLLTATKDLLGRANEELKFCMRKAENTRKGREKSDDICL
ncbi:hypothetical protein AALD01_05115 [Oscillospiraceae bacterium 21-37]